MITLSRIQAVFLKDLASITLLLLQICLNPSFKHVIFIPQKLNVFTLIITHNAILIYIFTDIYLLIFRLDIHITRFFTISPQKMK